VLTLVRAHALLHRARRAVDKQERVMATLDDYEAVRELVGPIISSGVARGVKSETRRTVEAVAALGVGVVDGADEQASVTNDEIAKRLGLDKSSTSRRVNDAIAQGYIVNLEPLRGRPSRLVLGEPLPDDAPVLPSKDKLQAALEQRVVQ
jgi:hypothetical protein